MEQERQKKIFLMRVGIISLMVVILGLWIFNLKNVWRDNSQATALNNNGQWTDLANDLNKTINTVKSQLGQMTAAEHNQAASASNTLITALVAETKNMASSTNLNSSSVMATTSDATSTISPANK